MSRIINDLVRSTREDDVYSPLPPGDFIRYLILQPGGNNDPLECTLHTSHLNSMPYFEAVSYVWGMPHRHYRIKCNKWNLHITANLHMVLRRLRSRTENRALWVDSICIDQNHSKEKSHQVAFMGQIFSRADRVLICLGSDDKNHGLGAASLIMELNEMFESMFRATASSEGSFPFPEEENLNLVFSDARWESVNFMQSDPWYLRGWVIQEAALANDAVLLWGSAEINWLHSVRVCFWVYAKAPQILRDHPLEMNSLHFDLYARQHRQEAALLTGYESTIQISPTLSILRVLHNGRSAEFYDPRDRIYAVQALADDASHKELISVPDYSKPYLAIYYDLAKKYIEVYKDLELLNYVQHTADTIEQQASSWAPRWDVSLGTTIAKLSPWPKLQSRDLANTIPSVTTEKTLKVRGILFDSVVFKYSELAFAPSVDEIASMWRSLSESGINSTYSPSQSLLAFVETLCAGRFRGDIDKWKAHRAAYILLLNEVSCDGSGSNQVDVTDFLEEGSGGDADFFHLVVQGCVYNRSFFVTERGYYGLGSHITSEGDICCILFGGKTHFIVRKTRTDDEYKLVGESWITSKKTTVTNGRVFMQMLGLEQYKDWLDWDITERDIYLV